ncbi:hypothetical protein TeGR_g8464 [Tetraparma gracilis]|uniref:Kinesin motor domain-containing protein n=1 Tax=Tetraparma gracilis TaxID=2962635 RepID=A0ABQ6N4U1_9STRA|nr:hypothetical protein TeGR_g8464 [Tetraparma gracilis]
MEASSIAQSNLETQAYKGILTEFQFEQIKLCREYQRLVAEKEADIATLEKKLSSSSSSSPSLSPPPLIDELAFEVEKLKAQKDVLSGTVSAWENKLKELLKEKTDSSVEMRKMKLRISTLEAAAPPPTSPSRKSNSGGDSETIDNLVVEYTKLSAESSRQQDIHDAVVREFKTRCEEYETKITAQEQNILMLMSKPEVSGDDGPPPPPPAEIARLQSEVEALKTKLAAPPLAAPPAAAAAGQPTTEQSAAEGELLKENEALAERVAQHVRELAEARGELERERAAVVGGGEAVKELEARKEEEKRSELEALRAALAAEKEKELAELAEALRAALAAEKEKELARSLGGDKESLVAELSSKHAAEKERALADLAAAKDAEKKRELEELGAMGRGALEELKSAKDGEKTAELESLMAAKDEEKRKELEALKIAKDEEKRKEFEALKNAKDEEKQKELGELTSSLGGDKESVVADLAAKHVAEKDRALAELKGAAEAEKKKELDGLAAEKDAEAEKKLADATATLSADKEASVAALTASLTADKDAALADLTSSLAAAKDTALADFTSSLTAEKDAAIADLTSSFTAEKDAALVNLTSALTAEKENALSSLKTDHESAIAALKSDQDATISTLKADHESAISTLKTDHESSISTLKTDHESAISTLNNNHDAAISTLNNNHDAAISALNTSHDTTVSGLNSDHDAAISSLKSEQEKTNAAYELKLEWFQNKTKELMEKHEVETAALQAEHDKKLGAIAAQLATVEERKEEEKRSALAAAKQLADEQQEAAVEAMKKSLMDMVASANSERDECKELYMKEAAKRKLVHNKLIELQGNIRVIARVRPVVQAELNSGEHREVVDCTTDEDLVVHRDSTTRTRFEFDRVCDQDSTQAQAYELVSPLVTSVLDGYNVCIFAYGQTGSGKTYTMEGPEDNRGVNFQAIAEMFSVAEERVEDVEYKFKFNMLEIYNETIRDLLGDSQLKQLNIRQTAAGNVVENLTEIQVGSAQEVFDAMNSGATNRSVGSHNMNEHSSRSHLVVCVMTSGVDKHNGIKSKGKLHLIDLAGSERISKTDATGDRLKEAQAINSSLSALGNVINKLGEKKPGHVPYRDSKLTQLLQDSLGGNSKVMMFVNLSPVSYNMSESLCSLAFAARCRAVQLAGAKKNDDTDKREIKKLRAVIRAAGIAAKLSGKD